MSNTVRVSFEFFPPNDEAMAAHLWAAVERLAPLQPEFVSVTYGADGSTRSRTHACVLRMLRETGLRVAPHLTCVGASREELMAIAEDYWRHGVRHLVALRGDAPGGNAPGAGITRGKAGSSIRRGKDVARQPGIVTIEMMTALALHDPHRLRIELGAQ